MVETPAFTFRERLRAFLSGSGRRILFCLVLAGFLALGVQRHGKASVIAGGL